MKYRRRSVELAIVVVIGGFVLTLLVGFMSGFYANYTDTMLETTAHGKFFGKGYYEKQEIAPLDYRINAFRRVKKEILEAYPSASLSASITAGAVVSFRDNSANMLVVGAETYAVAGDSVDVFPSYRDYAKHVRAGRFFVSNADRGVMIGTRAASNLGCGVGDKVIVFTSDVYGSFNAAELEVIGIFRAGTRDKDTNICLVDLDSIRRLTGLDNAVTEIAAHTDDAAKAEALAAAVAPIVEKEGLEFLSWKELLGSYLYAMKIGDIFMYVIYAIFILVAAVGIMNTVLLSIFDRIRDIGTLRAMGFTKNGVTAMVLAEVAIVGLVGAVIGAAMGGAVVYYFSITGIPLADSTMELMESFFTADALYPVFAFKYLVLPFLAAAIIPVAASIYPILIMRRMKVREALGYV